MRTVMCDRCGTRVRPGKRRCAAGDPDRQRSARRSAWRAAWRRHLPSPQSSVARYASPPERRRSARRRPACRARRAATRGRPRRGARRRRRQRCGQPADHRPAAHLLLGHEVDDTAVMPADRPADDRRVGQRAVVRDQDEGAARAGRARSPSTVAPPTQRRQPAGDRRAGNEEPGGLGAGAHGGPAGAPRSRSTQASTSSSPVSSTSASFGACGAAPQRGPCRRHRAVRSRRGTGRRDRDGPSRRRGARRGPRPRR